MKAFWITLFWKQNKWHQHGVLVHTLKVVYQLIKAKHYNMILAGLLHDIGKPFVAFQDEKDKITGEYSFTDHEEKSYQIIKNWPFISERTKLIVKYHYIIRDIQKSLEKGNGVRHFKMKSIWAVLDEDLKRDIEQFMICDDKGK